MMLNICTKFQENISKVSELLSPCDLYTEICKGHNSVKNVGGVMVLNLSALSDNA